MVLRRSIALQSCQLVHPYSPSSSSLFSVVVIVVVIIIPQLPLQLQKSGIHSYNKQDMMSVVMVMAVVVSLMGFFTEIH